jgi:DNA-binding transcriptional LysR family regulator
VTLHQLKIFLAVAKLNSFTRAAEELGMSQPDVSIHVRHLQDEVGINLFEIVGKKTYLTEAGEVLKEKAAAIFAQVQEASQLLSDMKGLARGSFHVGASTTIAMYILPRPISDFGKKYPGINIHLKTANSGTIERMVSAMDLELGFTVGIPIKQVKSRTFMNDEVVLILGPKHPFAKRGKVTLSELHTQTFVLRASGGSASSRYFEQLFRNSKARPKVQMELDSTQALKWAVAEGVGISLVPKHSVLQELKSGLLRIATIKDHPMPCPLNIVMHPQRKLSPIAQVFLEVISSQQFFNTQ